MAIPSSAVLRSLRSALVCGLGACLVSACSIRHYVVDQTADILSGQGGVFASDDDPELIRDAAPLSLKLIEGLIAERPEHRGLLLAAAKGFTQYSYAFVQQDADELENKDVNAAYRLRERAARLYRRALDYGLQGLAAGDKEFAAALRADPKKTLSSLGHDEVSLLYWTGAAWLSWIALSKDSSDALADIPIPMAMLDRALSLDEGYSAGALHSLLITVEMSRGGDTEQAATRSRAHFERAVQLSGGELAGPYVALAEAVAIPRQDRKAFENLLKSAINLNPDAVPDARLENHVMQRRARWLLDHADQYFIE